MAGRAANPGVHPRLNCAGWPDPRPAYLSESNCLYTEGHAVEESVTPPNSRKEGGLKRYGKFLKSHDFEGRELRLRHTVPARGVSQN